MRQWSLVGQARLFLALGWLLLVTVIVVAGYGAWAARDGYLRADRARQLQLANADMLIGMVNQETGLRGYVNNADPVFLEPYTLGQGQVASAWKALESTAGDRQLSDALTASHHAAQAWEAWALARKASVDASGTALHDVTAANQGKALFDAFRQANSGVATMAANRVSAAITDAQNGARLGFYLALGAGLLAAFVLAALGRTLILRTVRPLVSLASSARDLAAGRQSTVRGAERKDEIGDLARALAAWQTASKDRDHLFTLSSDMFAISGFDGVFRSVNPAWQQVTGLTPEQLTTQPYLDFVHPDDRAATVAEAGKLADGARTISFRNRYRCADGSYRWLDWTAVPVTEEQLIYAVARDVTERQDAEAAIQRLNAELEARVAERDATNKELEAFSYSVSHDLRAPLRAIHGFVRILLEEYGDAVPGEARRYLDMVANNAKQMGRLVDDLLQFSRTGKQPLNKQLVNTTVIARRALEQLQPAMEGRVIELNLADLPPVEADPSLLQQVFLNLIGNAIKYSKDRSPARIEVGSRADTQGQLTYFVRDNGDGFDMKYAHKLFGVFQRLHRSEEYEGTGVGLALVHRIITRHGGKIWPEAEVGKGATFYFTLGGQPTWQAKAA